MVSVIDIWISVMIIYPILGAPAVLMNIAQQCARNESETRLIFPTESCILSSSRLQFATFAAFKSILDLKSHGYPLGFSSWFAWKNYLLNTHVPFLSHYIDFHFFCCKICPPNFCILDVCFAHPGGTWHNLCAAWLGTWWQQ